MTTSPRKVRTSTKREPRGNEGKGRKKGVPNKTTQTAREAIAKIADGMAEEFEKWIVAIAQGVPSEVDEEGEPLKWHQKPDPRGAAEVYLKAIEYHVPKLSRAEVTGAGGKDLIPATINVVGKKAPSRE